MLASLCAAGCASERVILLEDEAGTTGTIEVRTHYDTVIMAEPLRAATIGAFGGIDSAPVSAEALRREFGSTLQSMPAPPSRFVLYFTEGTTRLVPDSRPTMHALLEAVAQDDTADIQVVGHTDRVGSIEDNDRLARDRAGFVRKMLLEQGLSRRAILAVGRGEREPLIPTADEVHEPRNRRVEIVLR